MTTSSFSLQQLFSFGWEKTKAHYWYLFCVFLLSVLASGASQLLGPLSFIVGLLISISVLTVGLMLVRGQVPTYADLFLKYKDYKILLNYLLASLLVGLIVVIGFILLIIPGVYIAIRLQFYRFLIIDKGVGVVDSLKQSMNMTEGNFWNLFLFVLAIAVFNLAGALLIGLGLLVTIPVSLMAGCKLYDMLKDKAHVEPSHSHGPDHNHEGHAHHDHNHEGHNHAPAQAAHGHLGGHAS